MPRKFLVVSLLILSLLSPLAASFTPQARAQQQQARQVAQDLELGRGEVDLLAVAKVGYAAVPAVGYARVVELSVATRGCSPVLIALFSAGRPKAS